MVAPPSDVGAVKETVAVVVPVAVAVPIVGAPGAVVQTLILVLTPRPVPTIEAVPQYV